MLCVQKHLLTSIFLYKLEIFSLSWITLLLCVVRTDTTRLTHQYIFVFPSNMPSRNVSLDVLPVKGPQGPALRITEPTMQVPYGLFNGYDGSL